MWIPAYCRGSPAPVSVVVVVWQLLFWQFPTCVGPNVQVLVPLSLVKVPPAPSHCVCEGDAASAVVVPKANNDIDPSNINKAVLDIVLLLGVRLEFSFQYFLCRCATPGSCAEDAGGPPAGAA